MLDDLKEVMKLPDDAPNVPREIRVLVEAGMSLMSLHTTLYTTGRAWLKALPVLPPDPPHG